MKKFLVISLILFLILFTAFIKNTKKKINDEIFTINENIRDLKKNLGNIKLEHDYLSSADRLLEFQSIYFENELIKKDIQNIKIIHKINNNLKIKQSRFSNE